MAETVYGVKSPSHDNKLSVAPSVLFSFGDSSNPSVTAIGTVFLGDTGVDIDGLALSRSQGLFGFALGGSDASPSSLLVGINTATAEASAIGGVLYGREIRGGMFDSSNRLWAIDGYANTLLHISQTTGAILSEVALTLDGDPLSVLRGSDIVQAMDGTVFFSSYDPAFGVGGSNTLYTLNLSSGATAIAFRDSAPDNEVANLPLYTTGLAAGSGATADYLFGLDGDGFEDIFTYVRPDFTRTEVLSNILAYTPNSGGLDLASLAPLADVPEPATLALLALGTAGLIGARRRRS